MRASLLLACAALALALAGPAAAWHTPEEGDAANWTLAQCAAYYKKDNAANPPEALDVLKLLSPGCDLKVLSEKSNWNELACECSKALYGGYRGVPAGASPPALAPGACPKACSDHHDQYGSRACHAAFKQFQRDVGVLMRDETVADSDALESACGVKHDREKPWSPEVLAKFLGVVWVGVESRPQFANALAGVCSVEGLRKDSTQLARCYEGLTGSSGPFNAAQRAFAAKLTTCPAACAKFVADVGVPCAKAIDASFNYKGPGKPPGFTALAATRIVELCAASAAPEPARCAKRPFPNATIPSKYNLGAPATAASPLACCERCAAVAACKAWTLNPLGACQLKSAAAFQYQPLYYSGA